MNRKSTASRSMARSPEGETRVGRRWLIILVLILFFTLSTHSVMIGQTKSETKRIWVETVGILNPHGYNKGKIYYEVDGVMHSAVFRYLNDKAILGERYTMRYNANDLNEVDIDFWNPVFTPEEETHVFKAGIDKVRKKSFFNPMPLVVYHFRVGDQEYKKWIYLSPNYEIKYPNLESGQHYEVECWDKNPNRAVLHLDRRVK